MMDGFYEWRSVGSKKQPYYVHLSSRSPMVVPGIYEDSSFYDTSLSAHRQIVTFSIITTESVNSFRDMHDRQPMFLFGKEQIVDWLDRKNTSCFDILRRLELSYSSNIQRINEELQYHAVTTKMTDPLYQAADCAVEVKLGLRRIDSIFSKAGSTVSEYPAQRGTKRKVESSVLINVLNDISRDAASDSPVPSTSAAVHCPVTAIITDSSMDSSYEYTTADHTTVAAVFPASGKKAPSGRGESQGRVLSSRRMDSGAPSPRTPSQLSQGTFKSYFVR